MKKEIAAVNARFKALDPDKIEEGDIFKTIDGSVFKAIETPDYTVKVVLAKCLRSNNVWHVFGDRLYICIENGVPFTGNISNYLAGRDE